MIDLTPIRLAMRKKLLAATDITGKLAVPVNQIAASWDNREFTPPNPAGLWIRENWLPASERKVATGIVRLAGIFQYDAFDGVGNGTTQVDALALAIGNAFLPSTGITDGPVQIAIQRTERGGSGQGSAGFGGRADMQVWYQVPVRVTILTYQFIN